MPHSLVTPVNSHLQEVLIEIPCETNNHIWQYD